MHRFGITFHRNQRSRGTLKNELESIEGIGRATIDTLLKKFKSVKNIKKQSFEELALVTGLSKATLLRNYFSKANILSQPD